VSAVLAPVADAPPVGPGPRTAREVCAAVLAEYFDLCHTDYTPSTTDSKEIFR